MSGVGLWLFFCWDCSFKYPEGHGFLFVVSLMWCHIEVQQRANPSSRGVLPKLCVCLCLSMCV